MLVFADGNGFKTSTMRLGADVIVFSRCRGKEGKRFISSSYFPLTDKREIILLNERGSALASEREFQFKIELRANHATFN